MSILPSRVHIVHTARWCSYEFLFIHWLIWSTHVTTIEWSSAIFHYLVSFQCHKHCGNKLASGDHWRINYTVCMYHSNTRPLFYNTHSGCTFNDHTWHTNIQLGAHWLGQNKTCKTHGVSFSHFYSRSFLSNIWRSFPQKKQEIIRTCWSLSLHKTIVKYGKKTNDAVT